MPDRRTAIQHLLVIAGGAFFLPACFQDKGSALLPFRHLRVSGDEGAAIRELSETILPKTPSGPGATELHAHLFALKMADDCLSEKDRARFGAGLTDFTERCRKETGSLFDQATAAQRKALVTAMDTQKETAGDDLSFFYQSVKRWTVQAYTTSQDYLTRVRNYHIIPGKFVGSVPVTTS